MLGGEFELTSESGELTRWSDFDGQYRIIYFGYAYCPDYCPTDVQRAMAGLKLFEQEEPALGAQIQPLFVSVDYRRDTPEVVGEFSDNFHERLIGLSGTREQIEAVTRTFGVVFAFGDESPDGAYLMDHSTITYLFGPQGEPIATLPTDQGPEAVAAELARWVR